MDRHAGIRHRSELMDPARLALLADALADGHGPHRGSTLDRLLRTGAELLGVTGASVAIVRDGEHRGTVAASGRAPAAVDELQFTLGEGPCIDADISAGPVLEPDLRDAAGTWPAFGPAALALGCCAAFAFPLRIGAARVGVLGLYRDQPGALDARDLADALTLANVATHVLLTLEDDLEAGSLPGRLPEVLQHRRVVHQATGMIAAQLDVDPATAIARLRGWAWAQDRSIDDVATDVVAGAIRFPRDP
jgi:hypothetical protein